MLQMSVVDVLNAVCMTSRADFVLACNKEGQVTFGPRLLRVATKRASCTAVN